MRGAADAVNAALADTQKRTAKQLSRKPAEQKNSRAQ
jgi:hypothetical protein